MGLEIVRVDPAKATYALAEAAAEVQATSFEGNPFFLAVWGEEYFFSRPVSVGLQPKYRSFRRLEALKMFDIFRNPNNFNVVALQDGKVVGLAIWFLPPAIPREKVGLWVRIKAQWDRWVFKALNFLQYGFGFSPHVLDKVGIDLFGRGYDGIGITVKDPAQYRAKLAHLSDKELETATYLRDDTFWCEILGISPDLQGKGVGKKLFNKSIEMLPRWQPTFEDGDVKKVAPPHYGLVASAPGVPFYKAVGWSLKTVVEEIIPDRGDRTKELVVPFRLMHLSGFPKTT